LGAGERVDADQLLVEGVRDDQVAVAGDGDAVDVGEEAGEVTTFWTPAAVPPMVLLVPLTTTPSPLLPGPPCLRRSGR